MDSTATLARFIASGGSPADPLGVPPSVPLTVPPAVRHETKRGFLNALGCAIGGANDAATELLWTTLQPFAGAPGASLLGRSERTDVLTAALVNGYATNILDFDDTHLATVIHPGPPMLGPLLALVESHPSSLPPVSGADLLDAFLIGMEVACRLGVAIGPGHYARGWHITGTCGVVGAAAASARLLRLDAERTAAAIGIAATQASGLSEMLGGMGKTFNIARAGSNGLQSALLAARGFTSSARALEAPRGFGAVLADGLDGPRLVDRLGSHWEAAANTYKPFPCGIVLHPLIDACLQIGQAHAFEADAIDAVEVRVHPLVLVLTGRTDPKDGLESKLSYTHACAVALVDRAGAVAQFTDARALDPLIARTRARVSSIVDQTLATDQTLVTVRLTDGRVLSQRIEHAIGSRDNPMSDRAVQAKFLALATLTLSAARAQALLDACWGIDDLPQASALIALARVQ